MLNKINYSKIMYFFLKLKIININMETYFKKYSYFIFKLIYGDSHGCGGGITRITDSGLSMTTWNFFKGIIPPLNNEIDKLFNLYKEYPEYKLKNLGMSLPEFKNFFLGIYS